jgi:hypothetical protein
MTVIWKMNGEVTSVWGDTPDTPLRESAAVRANYKEPIRLESMGFLAEPEDVAEHRRRFPDVDLQMEDGSAIPIMRSLGQKRRYFQAAGLVDTRSYY